jgi:hypothetical protein
MSSQHHVGLFYVTIALVYVTIVLVYVTIVLVYVMIVLFCVTIVLLHVRIMLLYVTIVLQIEFMQEMSTQQRLCVATMAGTVMVTRSPATAIAVLKEVDGRGPFCSVTLNVVILKDMFVIILYALNMEGIKFVEKVKP